MSIKSARAGWRFLIAAVVLLSAVPAQAAEEPIEIFDAHLHYNWEPTPYYQVDEILGAVQETPQSPVFSPPAALMTGPMR